MGDAKPFNLLPGSGLDLTVADDTSAIKPGTLRGGANIRVVDGE